MPLALLLVPFLLLDLPKIAADAGGTVGVSAVHLETGRRAGLHNTDAFPMASTYKLAIAVAFLSLHPDLDRTVTLQASDIRAFRSPVADRAPHGGLQIAIGELFDQMLLEGDNTAADYILHLSGGPSAVTAHLRKLGIEHMRIDRSEAQLAFDFAGVTNPPPQNQWTLDLIHRLLAAVPDDRQRAAAADFSNDPRDTATPDAMVQLLTQVQRDANPRLLDRMTRMGPGAARIKGLLPPGTPVAHRTGNGGSYGGISSAVNDVGIITTPTGHIALAIFIQGSRKDLAAQEQTMARIAKALYDDWK